MYCVDAKDLYLLCQARYPAPLKPFAELLTPQDAETMTPAHIVLDDLLTQPEMEEWLNTRTKLGWPNDGGA